MKSRFTYWRNNNNEARDGLFVMFLALMLLLLAFFILLSSMATISREKYNEAIKSIESTFHINDRLLLDSFINASIFGKDDGPDKDLEKLGNLFKAELPLVKTTYINSGKTLKVTVSTEELFDKMNHLNTSYYALFDRMIDLLNTEPYFLYVFISRMPGDFSLEFENRSFEQINYLNHYLSEVILDDNKVDLGIDYGAGNVVSFYLSRKES